MLDGDLWLRGSGDPRLVIEDLWLLVQRIRGSGRARDPRRPRCSTAPPSSRSRTIPAAFDGEALRPYNAGPDALLLNYKAVSFHFVPDTEARQVRVYALPAIAGMVVPATVKTADGACNDWRARVGGDFADPLRPQFRGAFPLSCGDKRLARQPVHTGAVRAGRLSSPSGRRAAERGAGGRATASRRRMRDASRVHESRPLAEVIRDINKFSNNVMARQLFLTHRRREQQAAGEHAERAQRAVGDWLASRGLRSTRVRAGERRRAVAHRTADLGRAGPPAGGGERVAADAGIDVVASHRGCRRHHAQGAGAAGSAHIKTGLLADTRAIAGYVLAASGRRDAIVALVNHPNAGATQGALDALLNWVYAQG